MIIILSARLVAHATPSSNKRSLWFNTSLQYVIIFKDVVVVLLLRLLMMSGSVPSPWKYFLPLRPLARFFVFLFFVQTSKHEYVPETFLAFRKHEWMCSGTVLTETYLETAPFHRPLTRFLLFVKTAQYEHVPETFSSRRISRDTGCAGCVCSSHFGRFVLLCSTRRRV